MSSCKQVYKIKYKPKMLKKKQLIKTRKESNPEAEEEEEKPRQEVL